MAEGADCVLGTGAAGNGAGRGVFGTCGEDMGWAGPDPGIDPRGVDGCTGKAVLEKAEEAASLPCGLTVGNFPDEKGSAVF